VLQSRGALIKAPTTVWEGTTAAIPASISDAWRHTGYAAIYGRQLWVAVLVNKLARATARLPLKVYERAERGRPEARGHPYAALLAKPNPGIPPFVFWQWTKSTLELHGEAFLVKVRDRGGRPVALRPLHPTKVHDQVDQETGRVVWSVGPQRVPVNRWDLVHLRHFSPNSAHRGMSPLEPLRSTLENEDGARRANSAIWRNGSRPSVALKHPGQLSENAQRNLRASWQATYGGVDNWGVPAVLEEGMEAQLLTLTAEELQYVEARKLNREEVCAIFDVPPPVVHILDRATFSNITEQMRSMYRDTMAPQLQLIESTLETELRDGRMGRDVEPDFGDAVYAEFLLDGVLRGDFEARTDSYTKAISSGYMTPAEVRELENLPFREGSDQLLVNSAVVPLEPSGMSPMVLAQALQRIYLSVGKVITAEEAREILNRGGAGLTPGLPDGLGTLDDADVRTLMGRLSRPETLDDVDPAALTRGLNGHTPLVLGLLDQARTDGLTVAQFRSLLLSLRSS
jgi:HK97 family phage portal protein